MTSATPRTTTRRKPAAAKPAAKPTAVASPDPVPPVPGEELPPVVSLKTSKTTNDEMVPIFELDGREFSIIKSAKMRTVINAMWSSIDTQDPNLMMLKFIHRTVGPDAFDALLSFKDLDFDVLTGVFERITAVTVGKKGGDAPGNA